MKQRRAQNPWLHRWAVLTGVCTLVLICMGGLVTSHEAGLSVPDWPNSYGYNMFFFPASKWIGNIFYEHTHRLAGAAVGLMTVILAFWLWRKEERGWVRDLGYVAVFAVILQGVLGGLRVVLLKHDLAIVHAILAQLFFLLIGGIALCTSRWWHNTSETASASRLRFYFLTGTVLIFAQLMIGATMRQQHAGLSIPDFPLAYGRLWPKLDPASIAHYNEQQADIYAPYPITAFAVVLQMIHRFVALGIFITVLLTWLKARRLGRGSALARGAALWVGLVLVQIGLGAWTIWSAKAADIATAHVAGGAICFLTGGLLALASYRLRQRQQILDGKVLPGGGENRLIATPNSLSASS